MSIWEYKGNSLGEDHVRHALSTVNCLYCRSKLSPIRDHRQSSAVSVPHRRFKNVSVECDRVRACTACGWWTLERTEVQFSMYFGSGRAVSGAAPTLKTLHVQDQSVPVDEIRSYLLARYDARKSLHPRLFEHVVASVYRSLGYRTRTTARSSDGGVDVFLEGPDGELVGVEVKRYRNKIGVELIRHFAGALMDNSITRGVYVTTSTYTRGARQFAHRSGRYLDRPIELVDAVAFLKALGLAQRNTYRYLDDESAPFNASDLKLVKIEKSFSPGAYSG